MSAYDLGVATLGTEVDLKGLGDGLIQGEAEATSKWDALGGKLGGVLKTALLGSIAGIAAAVGVGLGAAFDFAQQANQGVNDLQASLGVTRDEAERLGDVAKNVFANNWGDSLDDVNQAVIDVEQQFKGLGGISDEMAAQLTSGAFALRDTFGGETTDYISAARTLMEQFGISSQQALDFVTSGMQGGLNSSGDFLDSIGEYSTQFANAGADAGQFFSVMETGLGSGVLGTDKAADLFKEFTLRITDGSSTTADALKGIGLSADELGQQIASGQLSKADVFDTIIDKLRRMDDSVARDQIATALLGTQYEDMGLGAALAISTTNTALDDLGGATDTLNAKYNNFGALWEGIKRQALVALEPLGTKLLGLANDVMPQVQLAFTWLQTTLPPLVDAAIQAFDQFGATLQTIAASIQPVVDFIGANLTPILAALAAGIVAAVVPAFIAWGTTMLTVTIPAAIAAVTAMAPIILTVGAIALAVGLLVAAWQNDWGGIRTTIEAFWTTTGQPIFEQLRAWLAETLTAAIQALADFWTNTLQPALSAVWAFISGTLIPIFVQIAGDTFATVGTAVQGLADLWTNVLQPALNAVWSFISAYVIPILGALVNLGIAVVQTEVRLLAELWTNVLQPALSAVWSFVQQNVIPILASLAGTYLANVQTAAQNLASFWTNTLQPAFSAIADAIRSTLGPAFTWLMNNVLGPVAASFGSISSAVSTVIGWINDLIHKLDAIHIPSILEQHSPSPLEQSVLDVGAAFDSASAAIPPFQRGLSGLRQIGVLPPLSASLPSMVMPRPAGRDPIGGHATSTTNVNIDARGANVTRGQIRKEVEDALRTIGSAADAKIRTRTA